MRKKILTVTLAIMMCVTPAASVYADRESDLREDQAWNAQQMNNMYARMDELYSQKQQLAAEINSLDTDLVNVMVSIQTLNNDIETKKTDIKKIKSDLKKAKKQKEKQYEAMKKRIQYLYETGQESYVEMLLTSESVADLVNKVDYAEELQEYDRRLLDEYKAAKQAVIDLQAQLEEEKQELLEMEEQLKEEKANLESVIAQKRSQIADFDSQLSAAKAKVSEYQKKIKEQNAQIKQLQKEEEAKRKAAAAQSSTSSAGSSTASSGSTSGYSSKSSGKTATVSGGGGGSSIASTGLRYVGNPYVYGGNSLTNGTDCSGFVHLIYAACGISTPRDSNSLAGGGRAVSESEMLPGDVVCYYGHVGIYIGNGQIVHASTPSRGIKVSNMYYRSIRCVRRYW